MVGRNRQFRYQFQARSNITEGDSAALLCLQANVRQFKVPKRRDYGAVITHALKTRITLRRHFVLEAPGQGHRAIDDYTHLRPLSRTPIHDKPSTVVPSR